MRLICGSVLLLQLLTRLSGCCTAGMSVLSPFLFIQTVSIILVYITVFSVCSFCIYISGDTVVNVISKTNSNSLGGI